MSQGSNSPSPFRDGFAALRHEPALMAVELTWRWCFGLSAWGLGTVSYTHLTLPTICSV